MAFVLSVSGILLFASARASAQGVASWVVVDVHSKYILMGQNGEARRPVDGFAGVATALVTLDWAQRTGFDPGRQCLVPVTAVAGVAGNPMGMQPGDQVSLRDLIYSVLLGADDAACLTLADTVGQDLLMRRMRHGDPMAEFVKEMNYLAAMNAMRKTRFLTPHGGPAGGRSGGTTTTNDLARLAIYAMDNPAFRFYSMQPDRAVAIQRTSGEARFRVKNYNRFAGVSEVDGVKALARGTGGPGAILTSKRNPEVTPMPDGQTLIYPRRLIVVANGGGDPAGVAWQLLASGWEEFDRWSAGGRPVEKHQLLSR